MGDPLRALGRLIRRGTTPSADPRDTRHTLIVPTFNRVPHLDRLLTYLETEDAGSEILVLDSSSADSHEQNASRIARSGLRVRHVRFPVELDPYLKIREGSRLVTTPYCSLCADDDLVLVPTVRHCVAELEREAEASAAHGWYFNFVEGDTFDLSYVVYRGASLSDTSPVARLRRMLGSYEAVVYAVYRTHVFQAAFAPVARLATVLGRELLTAALTAFAGKVIRLPDFYYGRSTGQSVAYERWHPHQIIAESPDLLFREYQVFREILLENLPASAAERKADEAGAIVDLVFLRYLGPFLRSDLIDLIIDERMNGVEPNVVVERVWDVFVRCSNRAQHPLEPLTVRPGSFAPDGLEAGDAARDYVASSQTRSGTPRTYKIFYEFLFPELKPPAVVGRDKLLALLARIDAY